MLKEFKEFAIRGNMIDLAVGVIIGAAFSKIVDSLLNDLLLPPLGMVMGRVDFNNLYVSLSGEHYASLAAATEAGAPLLKYGHFLSELINFLILAFVVFLLVRFVNRLRQTPEEAASTKACPYCCSPIALEAVRCPQCTAALVAPPVA
jgi:large conductance mechanosensitive channel